MKKIGIVFGIIFLIIVIAIASAVIWYDIEQQAPIRETEETAGKIIDIENGMNSDNIYKLLEENGVIRSSLVAKIYAKLNKVQNLKAGKYQFEGELTLEEVLNKLQTGDVMDETIQITFVEGKNMRYIASTIAEKTNNTTKDVYELLQDKNYISSLIDKYWFLTEDVQNTNIYYPLEGYLYPDTYTFENIDVDVKEIFKKMLDKMEEILNKYKTQIQESNYSVHEILTISSIVELEGTSAENRPKIASVIYNRLAQEMPIGSDVTTYYAIKVDMGERDLYAKEINTYNGYNTRGPNMEGKLPIGPISSPSEESIQATLNPAEEGYLYFVSDKNKEIYFSNTYEEHQETIVNLRKRGLWYTYE